MNENFRLHKAIELIQKELELQNKLIAADQKKLNDYSKKNPDKLVYINDRQTILNTRAQSIDDMETVLSFMPGLIQTIKNKSFHAGFKSFEQKNNKPISNSYFFNEAEKEQLRAFSIAEAQLKYNY